MSNTPMQPDPQADRMDPQAEEEFWHEPEDKELRTLRSLLFQRELNLLRQLNAKKNNRRTEAEHLSNIIAEAIVMRAGKDNNLDMALEPLVGKLVRSALQSNQHEFTNALFPLMGPSIRKSIAESFRGMLESFSKSMEMAFSWKGLRWRFEALRTGKNFSEVVLLHTLVYRVEEIFLIHSPTGINLMHIVDEGLDAPDASMISAMLTAIQDFVQDCLTTGKEGDLESMQHGDHTFMVEKHSLAYLACIVRGTPPAGFREQMRACLEYILVEYSQLLEHFSGDTLPFAACRPQLEKLLQARFVDEDRPIPIWTKILVAFLSCSLVGGVGFYKWRSYQAEKLIQEQHQILWDAVDYLRKEPGLVIFHVETHDSAPWQIFGLRDDIARTPVVVLQEHSVDPVAFEFRLLPFVSYDPNIIRERVYEAIIPPSTARIRFSGGVLYLAGTAPVEWILDVRRRALLLPGVRGVDTQEISDPRMAAILDMIHRVENTVVEFSFGKDTPLPQDLPKLTEIVDTLAKLEKLAEEMSLQVSLTVYGHADPTGPPKINYDISQARTKTIAAMLYAKGSSMPISIYGLGADYTNQARTVPDQASRKIEMRVRLSYAADASLNLLE